MQELITCHYLSAIFNEGIEGLEITTMRSVIQSVIYTANLVRKSIWLIK